MKKKNKMKEKKTNEKWKSQFDKSMKVRKSQHAWIRENKDTRTDAGYLDKIINYWKKNHGK